MNTDIFAEWSAFELVAVGEINITVGHVVAFLVTILVTLIASKLLTRALQKFAGRESGMTSSQVYVLGRILHYFVLAVGFLVAISFLGIDTGKLALVASALGVGIGLGLQGVVNNFVSGLVILLERSINVGDFIELDSELLGEVKEIHIRATLIRTNDNVDILVPNSELTGGKVINWTLEENIRRFRIPFGVAYGSDKELVKKSVLEAAKKVQTTLSGSQRDPQVWMTGFGDSSLDFELAVWVSPEQVKRPALTMSEYFWAIDDAFRENNIEIPFPQRDLHLRSDNIGVGRSGEDRQPI